MRMCRKIYRYILRYILNKQVDMTILKQIAYFIPAYFSEVSILNINKEV